MRRLVGTYPCVKCGTDCVVKSRAHIASAMCQRCRERARLMWLVVHHEETGRKALENISPGETAYLRAWSTCLFKYAEATATRLQLLDYLKPHERARMLRIVHQRLEWSHKQVGKIQKYSKALADEAAAMELTVVEGGDEPEVGREPPTLRLVPREGT